MTAAASLMGVRDYLISSALALSPLLGAIGAKEAADEGPQPVHSRPARIAGLSSVTSVSTCFDRVEMTPVCFSIASVCCSIARINGMSSGVARRMGT